ncbi:MAG: hypothetical protein ACRDS9_11250 [Pseudonocardiaceae bacterium]
MQYKARSLKQEQAWLTADLRSEGKTWLEIATIFRMKYRVNARVAFRWAHCWTQQQAADEWNQRWPDEPRTFKSFSYWEVWPSATGHEPSLGVLGKLAQLYECSVSDLVVDLPDYRSTDCAYQTLEVTSDITVVDQAEALLADLLGVDGGAGRATLSSLVPSQGAALLVQRLEKVNLVELTQVIVMWMHRLGPMASRRELLSKLSVACVLATAAPLFDVLDPDEHERVTRVIQGASDFSEPALHYCETMASTFRQQCKTLGCQLMLQPTIDYRDVARGLAKSAPSELRQRAISVYAELTQLVGWECFNLGDYRSAQYYYDDARSAAHDAHNTELVTYTLTAMSWLATWQGKAGVGIDHAIAAHSWAEQTGNPRIAALAADVAAVAFASDGQPNTCRNELEAMRVGLAKIGIGADDPRWRHACNESNFWGTASNCALLLGDSERALEAVSKSLDATDPADIHNRSFRMLFQAEAFVQKREIAEASRVIGEVVMITATLISTRIDQRIAELRAALKPWRRSKPVRQLDELLTAYSPSSRRNGST